MILSLQIKSIIFSFAFGIIFSLAVNLNYNLLFAKNIIFKILITIIFLFDFALIYFIIIRYINNGVINNYFYLFILLGFLLPFSKFTSLRINVNLPKSVKNKKNKKK